MPPNSLDRISPRIIKDLLKDKFVVFCHDWYWPIIVSYIAFLSIIDPILVVYCYMIPAGYSKFISGVQLTFVHYFGYRNFETSDNSTNSLFWNWVTLGEGLHNNHHARPGEYRFDFTKKPGEFDFAGFLVEKLLVIKT
jgi:stearoyl-CoA desaturase (delta-9 desaturase)